MQDNSTMTKPKSQSDYHPAEHEAEQNVIVATTGSGGKKKQLLIVLLGVVALIIAGFFTYPFVDDLLSHVETDNAYITGHVHGVSPRIAGTVKEVLLDDNQPVKAGDVLLLLDDRDEVIEVRKAEAHLKRLMQDVGVSGKVVAFASSNAAAANKTAEASLANATSTIAREEHAIGEAEAGIAMAEQLLTQRDAELRKAALDLHRYEALEKAGAVATENLDTARRDHDVAVATKKAASDALEQAKSRFREAQSQLGVAKAQYVAAKASSLQAEAAHVQVDVNSNQKVSSQAAVQEAQVDLDNARLRLSYTKIVAPIDGRIGRKTVEVGQRVQPGSPLLAVVSDNKWVVANYKETQLRDIRIGQRVKLTIDTFGDHVFTGRVDSFSPASGAAFALLPPDNATGNFTKIVQRIPVKILLDDASIGSYKSRLTPGMSCVVKVQVR
jgi:membrane fusion protein (multidrug efflux system)